MDTKPQLLDFHPQSSGLLLAPRLFLLLKSYTPLLVEDIIFYLGCGFGFTYL